MSRKTSDSECELASAKLVVRGIVKTPGLLRVPEMMPLALSKESPAGNVPTLQLVRAMRLDVESW